MRITTGMSHINAMNYLGYQTSNLNKLNTHLLSGKRVLLGSDDPISMTSILNNRKMIGNIDQYEKNISTVRSHIETTEGSLQEMIDIFERTRELLIQASTDSYTQDERDAIANELIELKDQVGILANTKYGDFYLFGGSDISKPPYNRTTGAWEGNANANKPINVEVAEGVFMPINMDGEEIFNGAGMAGDIFEMFDGIIADLKAGDTQSLRDNRIDQLDKAISQNLKTISQLGSSINRLDIIASKNTDLKLNAKDDLSEKEDADIAEVYIQVQTARAVYQAGIAVTGKLLQTSLIDHLV